MSEFVGRTGSNRIYSYPETGRSGGALSLARNYAAGIKGGTISVDPALINWNSIDVGPDPSTDVQITPLSTGEILVSGVVVFFNSTGAPIDATITVQLDSVAIPVPVFLDAIQPGATASVPFLVETEIISPLNETHLIQISVTGVGLFVEDCVVNVQEVPVSTG